MFDVERYFSDNRAEKATFDANPDFAVAYCNLMRNGATLTIAPDYIQTELIIDSRIMMVVCQYPNRTTAALVDNSRENHQICITSDIDLITEMIGEADAKGSVKDTAPGIKRNTPDRFELDAATAIKLGQAKRNARENGDAYANLALTLVSELLTESGMRISSSSYLTLHNLIGHKGATEVVTMPSAKSVRYALDEFRAFRDSVDNTDAYNFADTMLMLITDKTVVMRAAAVDVMIEYLKSVTNPR